MMEKFYVDLHIHIGRTFTDKAVKITASKQLTLTNILKAAIFPKGLHMIGIIDCHSPEVIQEMTLLTQSGQLVELKEGGLLFQEKVTLIPGCEIEVYDQNCHGPLHVLSYFPHMDALQAFSEWLATKVTNIQLSTQRIYEDAIVLQEKVKSLGGLFIPAHVFTPFKSLFGKGVKRSISEVLNPDSIDAIELGLSSNTKMADQIVELHRYPYVSNSDAHSIAKIAREYQSMELQSPTFLALEKAFKGVEGNKIIANYGLDPYLGKYHRTTCSRCFAPKLADSCPNCGGTIFTKGVSERINELSTKDAVPPPRPPYIHQVPLDFLPGLGPKTLEKLFNHFGSEMNILHHVKEIDLRQVLKPDLANLIMKARNGELQIVQGGGGKYGKVDK